MKVAGREWRRVDPAFSNEGGRDRPDLQLGRVHRTSDLVRIGPCPDRHRDDRDQDKRRQRDKVASTSSAVAACPCSVCPHRRRHDSECTSGHSDTGVASMAARRPTRTVRGWRGDASRDDGRGARVKRSLALALALVALAGLVIGSVPAFATAPSTTVRLVAAVSRVPAGAARLGVLPSDQQLTIRVVLRPSHSAELAAVLRDLYDPASPRYEKWLTPGEFNREFGPDQAEISAVTAWLRSRGLTETNVQGMTVRVVADARDVARAFSVSFARYRLASGTTGYAENVAPLVPASTAAGIAAIFGTFGHGPFPPGTRRQPAPTADRSAAQGRGCRQRRRTVHFNVRGRGPARRNVVLDAAPGRQPVPRERPSRRRADRQRQNDRSPRTRPEPPCGHQRVSLVFRSAQHRSGRTHRRWRRPRPDRHTRS